ncbi:hypothetical protein B0E47_13480 [Rhodanobacter sp. B05]|uniref:hypothetical protein n=1 Tax=Rhodanobacter sp. B05 TaxID=1945859 RepID=UPI0009862A25|nr:hypothetical protein [Rhodanobacter sp. B05]OOG54169.1 hypothetical protein B0E47_13480 [Rhodanobacter sp. B05]
MTLYKRLAVLLVLILISGMVLQKVSNPVLSGDGIEYLGMSQSLLNHLSPDLRRQDYLDLLNGQGLSAQNSQFVRRLGWTAGDQSQGRFGYFETKSGKYYPLHFWIYSLANVAGLAICLLFKMDSSNSFLITNFIVLLLAITCIIRSKRYHADEKSLLLILAVLCGSSFYLNWTGPEVFTLSLLTMGGVFFGDRRYLLSALVLAVAAQQNPPVGFACLACMGFALPFAWANRKDFALLSMMALKALVIGFILVLSPAFYYLNYGVTSLIVQSGQSARAYISLNRLISFIFDLNQGAIVGMPGLFLGLLVAVSYFAVKGKYAAFPVRKILALLLLYAVLVVPCLSTLNFNSGSNQFARYALWTAVPLGFALVELYRLLPVRWRVATTGSLVGAQVWLFLSLGSCFVGGGYLELSAYAKWMLRHVPSHYSPDPEIFSERGLGRDGNLRSDNTYYYVSRGHVMRVLYNERAGALWFPSCPQLAATHRGEAHVDRGWVYISPLHGQCASAMAAGMHAVRRDLTGDVAPALENATFSKIWPACKLPSTTGSDAVSCTRQAVVGHDKAGYLTFGPYIHLPAGGYEMTIHYLSQGADNSGAWDILAGTNVEIDKGDFVSTDEKQGTVRKVFTVPGNMDNQFYQFRTFFNGEGKLTTVDVGLKMIQPDKINQ